MPARTKKAKHALAEHKRTTAAKAAAAEVAAAEALAAAARSSESPNVHIAAAPRSRLGAFLNYTRSGRNAVGRAFRNLVTTASSLPAAAGRGVRSGASRVAQWIKDKALLGKNHMGRSRWTRYGNAITRFLNGFPILNRFRNGAATRRARRSRRVHWQKPSLSPEGAGSSRSINSPGPPAQPTGGVSSANAQRELERRRFLQEAGLPLDGNGTL